MSGGMRQDGGRGGESPRLHERGVKLSRGSLGTPPATLALVLMHGGCKPLELNLMKRKKGLISLDKYSMIASEYIAIRRGIRVPNWKCYG